MSRLNVNGLCKSFNSAAETISVLDNVNLTMEAGENLSIVGPSGCGKSTLLYILGTLDFPTAGRVEIDGVEPFGLSASAVAKFRNESIGFIFQDHHLLPQLTISENVLLPALASGVPSSEVVARAEQLIADVGLSERVHHLPGQLSGGERQRVAVARGLLHRPKLLLADEPTGNLDRATTETIAELLFDLPRREGAALIVVTHSTWLAEQAGRQMRLENRQLVEGQGANL
ncbi:ABC transporter ATP-binding protein [Aureliella helgolandensis]|uniref:Lipoprotein-releasing system ATP-binding protein LolD n=1 Tax=Aureliella helgolandensis TaxID=2527968 RepID=A0A518GCK9_9BACT|nr:ABC transporter ATP-binding protein [Aureliella helgolandensis]QDV26335.1 Lipoprotein-releasing system ATP-binding protein LolD [Aureliella helgolandensis]